VPSGNGRCSGRGLRGSQQLALLLLEALNLQLPLLVEQTLLRVQANRVRVTHPLMLQALLLLLEPLLLHALPQLQCLEPLPVRRRERTRRNQSLLRIQPEAVFQLPPLQRVTRVRCGGDRRSAGKQR